jgi:hypothetical protein
MSSAGRAAGATRTLAALAAAALVAVSGVQTARADGDPASDYLLLQNVYFSVEGASPVAETSLEHAADAVYGHGDRVKVALIDNVEDLGSVSALWGKPADYAQFLGIELGNWYVGPLLVVMPSGYGIYDGGRPTAAEQHILQDLPLAAGNADQLTLSAATAVERLETAGALRSPDVRAPLVTTYPASATRGRPATLRFDVFDDSGRTKATVRVYESGTPVATLSTPMTFAIGTRHARVSWQVPAKLHSRQLRFCVVAEDPSGNRSARSCAPFLRVT